MPSKGTSSVSSRATTGLSVWMRKITRGQSIANFCPSVIAADSIAFSGSTMKRLLSMIIRSAKDLPSVLLTCTLLFLVGCSSLPDLSDYTASLGSVTRSVPEFGRRSLNSVTKSVPELGMFTDRGTSGRAIVVRLSDQRAFLYNRDEVVAISPASTGREGYNTPTGKYRVIGKDIDHRSSLYGAYVLNGRVVKAGVDVRKDRKPPGAVFVGAPMPYYLQIAPSYGLHAGHVPGYPASHGCIRLPNRWAKRFYYAVKVGAPVWISH